MNETEDDFKERKKKECESYNEKKRKRGSIEELMREWFIVRERQSWWNLSTQKTFWKIKWMREMRKEGKKDKELKKDKVKGILSLKWEEEVGQE